MTQSRPGRSWGLVLLTLLLLLWWHKPLLKIYFILEYPQAIITASHANQLEAAEVTALVFVESRFNPKAHSSQGAVGLMQILPQTAQWVVAQRPGPRFDSADLLDPQLNLEAGCWYLAYLKDHFQGRDYLALAAYNAGAGTVKGWVDQGVWDGSATGIERVPFPETKEYLKQVIFLTRVYRYLYPELA